MLGKLVGCNTGNDTELVDCLRHKSPQELINQEWKVTHNTSVMNPNQSVSQSLFMFLDWGKR